MDTAPITDPVLLRVLSTAQQTRQHCLSILTFLSEHKQTTAIPSQDDALALSRLQKDLNTHLALLRGQHRAAVYSARSSKTLTATAKSEIDSLHLQLQNLFYEQRHLLGEIQGCEDYPHTYTQLSLRDDEDFSARMTGQKGEAWRDGMSDHDFMVAKINEEREERQRLEKERLELVKKKAELTKRNEGLRKELEKVDREVETWLDGRTKIEKMFEDKLGKEIRGSDMEVDGIAA
ncbi:hypothetical protein CAC42_3078 [Sphaceloma murrayae]|uniref:Uncharacterized protein n=1 Tax=Sphaceloma murrayae TaxID=2082308 RepID=A0A2K1QS47_9PEZI|nr:hypothetical protein CAC42_3078 [Sphaceloma murrayae]